MPRSVDTDQALLPSGLAAHAGERYVAYDPGDPLRLAKQIRWLRQSDGAVVAIEEGSVLSGLHPSGALSLRALEPVFNPDTAQQDPVDGQPVGTLPASAGIFLSAYPAASGSAPSVVAQVGKTATARTDYTVIDADGKSDFLQLSATAKWVTSPVLAFNYPAMGSGGETSNTFNVTFTNFLIMLGGLALNDLSGSELCTWAYTPISNVQTRVTVRNNSPFGMANGGTWQGIAIHD